MDMQEFVDRLVQAVEEQDVLYVLYWARELEQRGLLTPHEGDEGGPPGLDLKHSWKKRSPLVAAALQPCSSLSSFVLALVLSWVPEPRRTNATKHAVATGFVLLSSPEEAAKVKHIRILGLAQAADYIDAVLPPHPNPESLTGDGPLPPPPALAPTPSSSAASAHVASTPRAPPPAPAPAAWQQPHSRLFQPTPLPPPAPATAVLPFHDAELVRQARPRRRQLKLHLGNLPLDVNMRQRAHVLSAYCLVATKSDYERASAKLHETWLRGQRILLERNPPLHSSPHDPVVTVRGLSSSAEQKTIWRLSRSTRCGAWGECFRSEDGETVGVFRAPSPDSAQAATDLLDGRCVYGERISVEWRYEPEPPERARRSARAEEERWRQREGVRPRDERRCVEPRGCGSPSPERRSASPPRGTSFPYPSPSPDFAPTGDSRRRPTASTGASTPSSSDGRTAKWRVEERDDARRPRSRSRSPPRRSRSPLPSASSAPDRPSPRMGSPPRSKQFTGGHGVRRPSRDEDGDWFGRYERERGRREGRQGAENGESRLLEAWGV